jgi:hypothetical protein|tara:strand:+ start:2701 stop:2835 length:135 start_codon:yes stop_codon:yes gene_type:complete
MKIMAGIGFFIFAMGFYHGIKYNKWKQTLIAVIGMIMAMTLIEL